MKLLRNFLNHLFLDIGWEEWKGAIKKNMNRGGLKTVNLIKPTDLNFI